MLRSPRTMLIMRFCVVEFDDALGKIEIDGAVLVAARVEEQREFFHVAEMRRERLRMRSVVSASPSSTLLTLV